MLSRVVSKQLTQENAGKLITPGAASIRILSLVHEPERTVVGLM
jgi:hypothetical protein